MRDSFNNELQIGDRILCLEPREFNMHRINQVGTVAKILQNRIIVNFDLADGRDWGYPELNIPSGHSNYLVKNEDKFIKLETNHVLRGSPRTIDYIIDVYQKVKEKENK